MLETFKARLKAKYSGVNLSTKRIDAIADRLNKKFPDLKEEADHDAKLDDLNELTPFDDIAKDDDRIRTLEAKQKPAEPKPADPKTADPKPSDDMPAWFKTYQEETDRKIAGMLKDKAQSSIKDQLKEKLKDVPGKFYENWQLPESEEHLESFVTKVNEGFAGFKQDLTEKGLLHTNPGGGQTPPPASGKISPEIKAFVEKQKALESK